MEAQVGDHVGVLMGLQLVLCQGVVPDLGSDLLVGDIQCLEQGNGTIIVITGHQGLRFIHYLLYPLGFLFRGADGGTQMALRPVRFILFQLNEVGKGTDYKGHHQNQADTGNDGREVNLLKDLDGRLPPAAPRILGVRRRLTQFLVEHGGEIHIIELAEDIGHGNLGKIDLGRFPLGPRGSLFSSGVFFVRFPRLLPVVKIRIIRIVLLRVVLLWVFKLLIL